MQLGSTPAPLPSLVRPVKGVGRHVLREYCERCGLKRKNCHCKPEETP
jgi:DTW domain-containing protein YfiP